MTSITLKHKQIIEGETIVKSENFEIEEIDGQQFQDAMVILKEVLAMAEKEPAIKALFEGFALEESEDELSADEKFLTLIMSGFEVLLVNVPEIAFRLLSVLSGIDLKTVKEQKILIHFDIFDAIMEVNDFEKLIARAKKSLAVTKAKMSFLKVVKTATGMVKA